MGRVAALSVALLLAVSVTGCFGVVPNETPQAQARLEPEGEVVAGQEVTFIGSGHDADGSIARYEWDFGDGTEPFVNATRGATVHTYGQPGTYTATFHACDQDGACGEVSINVTVAAGLTVAVDWTGQNAYTIRGAPTLDAALIRVTLQVEGGSAQEFAVGQGLDTLAGGAYRAALDASTLGPSKPTAVHVYYNGTEVASRTVVPAPFSGSSGQADLRYGVVELEQGPFGIYNATTESRGQEVWLVAGGLISHAFRGSGSSSLVEVSGDGTTVTNQTFDALAWNETWGRVNPTLWPIDFKARGTGTIDSSSPGGVRSVINLTEYAVTVIEANLTDLRASGTGYYEGGLAGTFGAAAYNSSSGDTQDATSGDGETVQAVRIHQNVTYDGTLGGVPFNSVNESEWLVAANDRYFPAEFWVAWNDTTVINTTTIQDSGTRYLDSNGDGDFNPDLRPTFPSDGRVFAGFTPNTLGLGDRMTVTNTLGHSVVLEVTSLATDILAADGYTAQAVTVATLAGTYGNLGTAGAPAGSLTYSVVADGPHALLWMSGGEHLALGQRTFDRTISLIGMA